jgi:hypothetical protein
MAIGRWLMFVVAVLGFGALGATGCSDDAAQGDEQFIAECGGARIDEHGICRKQNGQFAKKYCCDCSDAAPDITGTCVRSGGELAPTACCEDICGGATLDAGGYCRKPNGTFALNNCCAEACGAKQTAGESIVNLPACKNFATECQGTSLDDHGFCRKENGTFAKAACCNASCLNTALDANGVCRNTETGRFAPATCCADACDGAALDANGICRKTNGQFALSACCADECFEAQEEGEATSAIAACSGCGHSECEVGDILDPSCSPCAATVCDADPFYCGLMADTTDQSWDVECTTKAIELCDGKCAGTLDSCEGSCGHRAPGNCWCDSLCETLGDCCADKVDVCG